MYHVASTTHHCNPEDHGVGHFFHPFHIRRKHRNYQIVRFVLGILSFYTCPLHTSLKESSVMEI
jgi:hypothetical protein